MEGLTFQIPVAWVARWRVVLQAPALLPKAPRRIILHWTGGGAEPNEVDRAHYHAIVGQSLRVVRGAHTIAENMRLLRVSDEYARHTGGFNSFSVGLAAAGMRDATLAHAGPVPLTAQQVDCLLTGAALGCRLYGLDPANPAHLFTHMEAWTLHRVKGQQNDTKADIGLLPFRPELKPAEVGPWLRARAKAITAAIANA